jgi:hypothetical protein
VTPAVTVTCGSCGYRFEISVRNEYGWRKSGREPRCETCRRPSLVMTDAERERYRKWWIQSSGLTERELYEIAIGLG